MRSFLYSLKTPAEIRRLNENKGGENCMNDSNKINNNTDPIEVGEEALETVGPVEETETAAEVESNPRGHLEFGQIGFGSFVGNQAGDGNDADSNVDSEKEDEQTTPDKCVNSANDESRAQRLSGDDVANETREKDADTNTSQILSELRPEASEPNMTANVTKKAKKTVGRKRKSTEGSEDLPRSARARKKAFLDVFKTLKKKINEIHANNGTVPDFALIVKNNLQSPDVKNAAQSAGKYLTFAKGEICDKFFSKGGISFHHDKYFLCKNTTDMAEDKILPFQKNYSLPDQQQPKRSQVFQLEEESEDSETSEGSESELEGSDVEVTDVFNTGQTAKKVRWGAPGREESDSSDSSGGVLQYGRGAEKKKSEESKKKKEKKKKHFKEMAEKSRVDILDGDDFEPSSSSGVNRGGKGSGKGTRGKTTSSSKSKGKGKATGSSRGKGSSRGSSRGRRGAK